MALFTQEDMDRLAGPHVARAMFLYADLPGGAARFHNGVGRKTVGGFEWRGVTDPAGGQLVGIQNVEDPRFGQAAAVTVTLSGANRAFFQSVHDQARQIEGRTADLFWAAFDGETEEIIGTMKRLFHGKITAPALRWQGVGARVVTLTVVGIWESQNYAFGGKWTDADQRRRYPGDKGLQYVGVDVSEKWK